MITSKDVFAKRKESIDEAYQMALELMRSPTAGEWDIKAFCWCVIDIIKRDAANGNYQNLSHYRSQLESVAVDPSDDILAKGIRAALSLCSPGGREISEAKALGREKRHAEAVAAYRKALAAGAADRETHTGFGWELYRHCKELMAAEPPRIEAAKRNLNDYLKLDVEKPSLLHSCMLQIAGQLAGEKKLSMLTYSRLWNLDNLRTEDFQRFRTNDGQEFPSLAEKVIRLASKEAISSSSGNNQEHILPYLHDAVERYPDNVYLKLDKAKLLLALGRNKEALAFALAVTKEKLNDYWAWNLLGDVVLQMDKEAAIGCYCKALSCPAEDKFTGPIRLKVAQYLLDSNDPEAAKFEIESIVRSREQEGLGVSGDVAALIAQPWFNTTAAATSNRNFYRSKFHAAESILFSNLPWIDACLGERYTVPGKDDKPKRKIYLRLSSIPTESSIPESRLCQMKATPGLGVRVKGELDGNGRFKVFVIEERETGTNWDVIPEFIGVVDHVNHEKQVLHFIARRDIDGVIQLSNLKDTFSVGDFISLRICRYISKNGPVYRVVQANATDMQPGSDILKHFCEEIRISKGFGFTESDVFLPPTMVSEHLLTDGQLVSGMAVLNFDKKKNSWGWKAISVEPELQGDGSDIDIL